MTTNTTRGTPSHVPEPKSTSAGEMPETMGWPRVCHWMRPPRRVAAPKVQTKEFIRHRVMSRPLNDPAMAPNPSPASTAQGRARCASDIRLADNTDDAAAIAPREKSKCPATSGSNEASAITVMTAWLAVRMLRLAEVGNVSALAGYSEKNAAMA